MHFGLQIAPGRDNHVLVEKAVDALKDALDMVEASKSALISFEEALRHGKLAHRDGQLYIASAGVVYQLVLKTQTTVDPNILRQEAKQIMYDLSVSGCWCTVGSEGQELISEELVQKLM